MAEQRVKPWPLKGHPRDCHDCGEWSGDYMLTREIWKKVVGRNETDIFLCLPCAQRRLGRPLTPVDFDLSLPANCTLLFGIQMGRRARWLSKR